MADTLAEMAVEVLTTADGRAKTALSRQHAERWFAARAEGKTPEILNKLVGQIEDALAWAGLIWQRP